MLLHQRAMLAAVWVSTRACSLSATSVPRLRRNPCMLMVGSCDIQSGRELKNFLDFQPLAHGLHVPNALL